MSKASDQATLFLIRGAIASLPAEDQQKVNSAHQRMKAILEEAGEAGTLAVALLGAELQMEADE